MRNSETSYRLSYLNRTLPFLTPRGQKILQKKTVAIAGCGGVGGIAALTLARMGVGHFCLADPGRFDLPDINRQVGANSKTLGKNKAKVYTRLLKEINPYITTTEFTQGITEDNVPAFLKDADLVIDCLDLSVPKEVRLQLKKCARQRQIYSFSSPVLGFGAVVLCYDPHGAPMDFLNSIRPDDRPGALPDFLYRIFMPEHLNVISDWLTEKKTKVPSTAVGPQMAASVVAAEAIQALIGSTALAGRPPISLPQVILIDLFQMTCQVVNVGTLLSK